MGGTYTLIIKLSRNVKIKVGKLGTLEFKKGFYAYTGSALGKAGFKRIDRYLDVESGRKKHWHIDYLLPFSEIVEIFRLDESRKMECKIAVEIGKKFKAQKGFGSTDCKCTGHLHYSSSRKSLGRFVAGRYINIYSG